MAHGRQRVTCVKVSMLLLSNRVFDALKKQFMKPGMIVKEACKGIKPHSPRTKTRLADRQTHAHTFTHAHIHNRILFQYGEVDKHITIMSFADFAPCRCL